MCAYSLVLKVPPSQFSSAPRIWKEAKRTRQNWLLKYNDQHLRERNQRGERGRSCMMYEERWLEFEARYTLLSDSLFSICRFHHLSLNPKSSYVTYILYVIVRIFWPAIQQLSLDLHLQNYSGPLHKIYHN